MTKRILIIAFILAGFACPQKKDLTLEQVITDAKKLQPKSLSQLQWIPGTSQFSYFDKSDGKNILVKAGLKGTGKETILDADDFSKTLKDKGYEENERPDITWIDKAGFYFWNKKMLIKYDVEKRELSLLNQIPEESENTDLAGSYAAAYTKGNNLFISVNGNETAVTNEKDTGIVNGQVVHRNEFGITKGTFWSPSAKYLAYYRMDQTMVTDYPVLDITTRPASVKFIKYPMAGMTSHQVTIGIYNTETGKTIFLKTGEPKDQYLTSITWDPSEKYIYAGHLNRDQNSFQLKQYNVETGDLVKTLFSESDKKYYEPLHPMYFIPGDNSRFLWLSREDGFRHLYLYSTDGRLIRQLTKGEWEIKDMDGIDGNGNAYFIAAKDSPLDNNYFMVNIESGKITRISSENGTHTVKRSPDDKYFLDAFSSTEIPYRMEIKDEYGKTVNKYFDAPDPLADYNTGKTKIFTIKSSDNYDLYCRMITPHDLDSTKKYPVLVYVYGGPHDQLIENSWRAGARLWLQYMAEQGFIVFTLDNRGSNNRGKEFEQVIFRNLGKYEIEDQVKGIHYLSTLSYADTSRIGVDGWSYGGFMTVALMTRAPEYFKVGVAGGAVIDWSYYEVMYTERYMDTPERNPDGYKESNLLNYVDKLRGKLLLVHGTSDPTVVWQNTLMYAKKAADLTIPLDYYPYVGHEHGVVGKDALHLYKKISAYFIDNLKNQE